MALAYGFSASGLPRKPHLAYAALRNCAVIFALQHLRIHGSFG
jgi:hypothetical protein